MTAVIEPTTSVKTLADMVRALGDVPLSRILAKPPPGTATEADLVGANACGGRVFELVDGVLVEKAMGYRESLLASFIISVLNAFVRAHNLGLVTGEAGMMQLVKGLVRVPDVAFVPWSALPEGRVPTEPVPQLVPALAVEVRSESNTARELDRKRGEYFDAGVQMLWIINPDARTVTVHTPGREADTVDESGVIEGKDVLPGFSLALKELFAELDRTPGPSPT